MHEFTFPSTSVMSYLSLCVKLSCVNLYGIGRFVLKVYGAQLLLYIPYLPHDLAN